MTAPVSDFEPALRRAHHHALAWLADLERRRVGPRADADQLREVLGGPLPEHGQDAADTVDQLATGAEPGLMAMPSGRFFGWVIGGTLPAALAADWLVSAWDQNAALRYATPAVAALEEVAGSWLLDLLHLPPGAGVGFVTGATMANFTGLAAARHQVLRQAGWDVHAHGLTGAPRVHVLVGAERHETVDAALRYLGLGPPDAGPGRRPGPYPARRPRRRARRDPGRRPGRSSACRRATSTPAPSTTSPRRSSSRSAATPGCTWTARSASGPRPLPRLAHLTAGVAGADSWATDAHKTLNVPYDCGVAIVADPAPLRAAFALDTSYLIADATGIGDLHDRTPELSRRARGVPVWAVLRSLGRDGVTRLVDTLARRAQELADGVRAIDGAEVLNDVVLTQVCVAFGDDARTREVTRRLIADGAAWMSGSRWQGRDVLRISVSNWSTGEDDVARSLDAVRARRGSA